MWKNLFLHTISVEKVRKSVNNETIDGDEN